MKPRIPYFNFYPSDFMHGVRGLTAQEVGIYVMLLCRLYEENGPVEVNSARLAAYCGCRQSTLETVFARLCDLGKIDVADGMFSNHRAVAEIALRDRAVKSASIAGKLSAEKRKQNQGAEATPVQQAFNHTDTDTDTDKEKREAKASQKNDADEIRHVLEAWASPAAADSFIAYRRKAKGKTFTLTAAKRMASHLRAIFDRGGDTDDALAMAEARCWLTIEADWYFNAKGNGNGNGHQGGNAKPGPHNALMAGFALAAHSKPQ